jgi:hypothetical protein
VTPLRPISPAEVPGSAGAVWLVRILALLPAALAIAALGTAMAFRVPAPFALEWQEPAMLEHSLRIAAGEPLYVRPSIEFAPFPYPPLFPLAGALSVSLLGPSLMALRLVSLLGIVLLGASLLRSFKGVAGVMVVGWWAATYGWSGFWVDVARVDTLALGLGAVAFALVLAVEGRATESSDGDGVAAGGLWWAGAAGLASALAVLTKQTQLGLAVALAVVLLGRARTRRAGAVYLGAMLAVMVPIVLWLEHVSSGWFLWTTVDLLRGSPFHGPAVWEFWTESSLVLGVPLALGLLAHVVGAKDGLGAGPGGSSGPGGWRSGWSPTLGLGCAALVLTGWIGRAHEGGFDNTLMPVALASAFACGGPLRRLSLTRVPQVVGAALVAIAMAIHLPRIARVLPDAADHAAYSEACAKVEALRQAGPVWQPISALPSGAPGYIHKMAIVDLAKSRETTVAAELLSDLREALVGKQFAAVILAMPPREGWGDLAPLIEAHYEVTGRLGATTAPGGPGGAGPGAGARSALTPVTGAALAPRWILTPRR